MVKNKMVKNAFIYIFLMLISIASVFPFFWMIVGMTNRSVEIIKGKLIFGNALLYNLRSFFGDYKIGGVLFNSFKISAVVLIGSLIISSMAAYGFEFYPSKTRERIYAILLATMMIPFAALMIPLFRLLVSFNLLDSHWGVILLMLPSVFLIFFFRQSFKLYPEEIIMAARVDGASELRIFFSIVSPMMKSTYAAAAIYSFMTSWNSYLWPLIVLQSNEQKTITLLISTLSSAYNPDFGIIMTAVVIATLPMIIIFFGLQRYFIQGILGSIKQ